MTPFARTNTTRLIQERSNGLQRLKSEASMQKRFFITLLCFAALLFANAKDNQAYAKQTGAKPLPKELRDLLGTFVGEWAIFGIDEKGQIVKKTSWTDTIKAENPVVKADRAYVTTSDEMIFEGGKLPPRKYQGTEGYLINKDGSLGDYFIESFGKITKMHKLADNIWAYGIPAAPQEIAQLGFSNITSAQHVLVKVVTLENGAQTHRITRVTTVNWRDKDGKDRCTQFVSLQGFHKKQTS
jgi:hypothetical protein